MQSQNLLIVPSRANDLSKSRKLLALPRICVLTLKVLVALLRADLLTGQAIKYVPGEAWVTDLLTSKQAQGCSYLLACLLVSRAGNLLVTCLLA